MGGGDQERLVKRLAGTPMFAVMKNRFNTDPNFIIGGTSAGAHAMSGQMIYEMARDKQGFGFTPIVIDTHVDGKKVKRMVNGEEEMVLRQTLRVEEALALGQNKVGLAIEEGVAVLIPAEGDIRVFGRKQDEHDEQRTKQVTFMVGDTKIPVKVGARLPLAALGLSEEKETASVGRP